MKIESNPLTYAVVKTTIPRTRIVALITTFWEGHVILSTSCPMSETNISVFLFAGKFVVIIKLNFFIISVAGPDGFEPTTLGFGDRCSTNWSYGPRDRSAKCRRKLYHVVFINVNTIKFYNLLIYILCIYL